VIVKIPRWNFDKFKGAERTLGLQMKSVGEVMAIGRTFIEALQKACQSLEIGRDGLGADGKQKRKLEEIVDGLENPSWNRLFLIKDALSLGVPINTIHKITKVDIWFLNQIQKLVTLEQEIRRHNLNNLPEELFWEIKKHGYADTQIAYLLGNCTEDEVYEKRKSLGITRVYKMVDTCAAEFPSETNYFYSSYETAPIASVS
jgi:carbamoyl-phosphate synthase large subunit